MTGWRRVLVVLSALVISSPAYAGPAEEVAREDYIKLQQYVGKRYWIVITGHPNNVVEMCSKIPTSAEASTSAFYKGNCLHLRSGSFVVQKLIMRDTNNFFQVTYQDATKYIWAFPATGHMSRTDPQEVKAECERRGQPKIGMTIEEATATCWGKPRRVVKTTTAAGVQQDFIYGSGHILRFENEKLAAILETADR
jgi:hypothetical protein